MYKAKVLKYFGHPDKPGAVKRCADLLEINIGAVMQWPDVIPEGAAYKLEVLTAHALKVDPVIYRRLKRQKRKSAA